ncbi:MAG: sensor histidine kinase [Burkholderiaceae bacterium]
MPLGFSQQPRAFRVYLTAALTLTALVPLIILVVLQARQIEVEAARADARQLEITRLLAADIEAYVATSRQLVELAAERLKSATPPTPADLNRVLEGTAKLFPGFMSLHFSDAQGKTLAFFPERNWRGEWMVGVDHTDRWHFIEMQRQGRAVISDVFKAHGATEKQLVSIASPARAADGRFLGYAAAGLDLQHIATIVAARLGHVDGYAVVSDASGNAIYHPRLDLDARPHRVIDDEVIAALASAGGAGLVHRAVAGNEAVVATGVAIPQLKWFVSVNHPVRLRDAALNALVQTSALLLLLVVALTTLVGWAAAQPLARAVGRLLAQVDSLAGFGQGAASNAREVAPVQEVNGPLELVQLQRSFKQMAATVTSSRAALLALNRDLECQVAERTASLSARNAELRQQHATLTAVFESMNEGVLLLGMHAAAGAEILYANRVAQALLGLEADEREAQPVFQRAFGAAAGHDPAVIQGLLASATRHRLHGAGPGSLTLDLLGFDVASHGETAVRRGFLLRDVTRECEIERLKESLISVVAHELKTPIAAMRIQAETLARNDARWEPQFRAGLLADMLLESAHLQQLVDDWLDVTRIEGGLLALDCRVVQIAGLIERAVRVVKSQYEIEIETRIARNAECANIDPARVTQLLINLLSNAARYSRGPAQARLSVTRAGQWIEIALTDQGIGIAPDQLERVFDKFYQVDMSMSRRTGGTGLGLAICRGIAAAHGGSIRAESSLGQWTRFVVRLPY